MSSRFSARSLACAFALAAACVGCAEAPTQLLVQIDSDLPTDVEPPTAGDGVLRAVHVLVCEERCEGEGPRDERLWPIGARRELGQVDLPISFGVAPRDVADPGSVEIVVEALRAPAPGDPEDVLFSTRRTISFARGRLLPVPIFLAAGCRGRTCPDGTTCGDDGQCSGPSPDAGLDASLGDAGSGDGGAPDGGALDGGAVPDAGTPDGAAADADGLDAGASDGGTLDGGADGGSACDRPAPAGPGAPTFVDTQRIVTGAVSAVSFAPDGSRLVGGVSLSAFEWDGVRSDDPAYFVSRRGVGGSASWTAFVSFDPARRSPWSSIVRVSERDGIVYVAAQAAEAWAIDGVTIAELATGDARDSRRMGAMLLALDAATGRALWGHGLKSLGATEFVGGLAVDASGAWLVTRWFGGPATSFRVDGTVRGFDRGISNGRGHLVHFDPAGGLLSVHGIDATSIVDLDVAALDGDVVLVLAGPFASTTPLAGLGAVPDGEVVLARLGPEGALRWASSVDCVEGTWSLQSAKLAVAGGRAFVGWSSSSRATDPLCTMLRVGDALHARSVPSSSWMGIAALDACAGESGPAPWTATVSGSPMAAFTSISADARGVAATGFFGPGGADLGLGRLPGRDADRGSDGLLVVLDHDVRPVHARIFGGGGAGPFTVDDGGESVALSGGSLLLGVALSGTDSFGAVEVPSGGSLVGATVAAP